MPPEVVGSFGTTNICIANSTTNITALLKTVNFFSRKSSRKGIKVNRHSMKILPFRKTEMLVIARISNFVLGSKDIYTIPALSKCFLSSLFPIIPPIKAQTRVPKIIAGIAHRLVPIE